MSWAHQKSFMTEEGLKPRSVFSAAAATPCFLEDWFLVMFRHKFNWAATAWKPPTTILNPFCLSVSSFLQVWTAQVPPFKFCQINILGICYSACKKNNTMLMFENKVSPFLAFYYSHISKPFQCHVHEVWECSSLVLLTDVYSQGYVLLLEWQHGVSVNWTQLSC